MRYYLHVLDHSQHAYINIWLSKEETERLNKEFVKYENLIDFIKDEHLDYKYNFNLDASDIMFADRNTILYKI